MQIKYINYIWIYINKLEKQEILTDNYNSPWFIKWYGIAKYVCIIKCTCMYVYLGKVYFLSQASLNV